MNCLRLTQQCECGGYGHPHALWITQDHQLLVTCMCIICEERFNVLFPLTVLYKSCPPPDPKQLNEAIGEQIEAITEGKVEAYDQKFLASVGIKFTAP